MRSAVLLGPKAHFHWARHSGLKFRKPLFFGLSAPGIHSKMSEASCPAHEQKKTRSSRSRTKKKHEVCFITENTQQPRPGWAPDPLMVGIRSPDGLVVGSCTSHPGVLGSIPKREEPGKTGAPSVKVPGSSRVPVHSSLRCNQGARLDGERDRAVVPHGRTHGALNQDFHSPC